MQDELVIELHSELPEIARLAGQVEAFGVRNNVPAIAIGHVNLALDELITNTISGESGEGDHAATRLAR
jgi:hypothetical protein